jgi:dethiobiotin synthetase/adenosylmethionine--8-amino-7-oxononanoate aminotransferase
MVYLSRNPLCQGPSVFTGDLQFPWYSGRGLWLEPALFAQRDGVWTVTLPGHLQAVRPPPVEL